MPNRTGLRLAPAASASRLPAWPELAGAQTEPWLAARHVALYHGDARQTLAALPDGFANVCITSPPYWRLRDYGNRRQLGAERDVEGYVAKLVATFAEVRRVLADDGSLWLNLGDTWVNKQMVGVPWRVVLGLQEDGWVLRADNIWEKPNCLPGSYLDRPTHAHEHVFLLTKQAAGYYYDSEHLREPRTAAPRKAGRNSFRGQASLRARGTGPREERSSRKLRSVWQVAVRPSDTKHLATYPAQLIEKLVPGSCPPEGIVLDVFNGSGTTGEVALRHGRRYVGVDLSARYLNATAKRLGL